MEYAKISIKIPIKILEEIMTEKPSDLSLSEYILNIIKNRNKLALKEYEEKYNKLVEWERKLEERERIISEKEKKLETAVFSHASELEEEPATDSQITFIKKLLSDAVKKGKSKDEIAQNIKKATNISLLEDLSTLTKSEASKIIAYLKENYG